MLTSFKREGNLCKTAPSEKAQAIRYFTCGIGDGGLGIIEK